MNASYVMEINSDPKKILFALNELEIKYNPTSHKDANWEAKKAYCINK